MKTEKLDKKLKEIDYHLMATNFLIIAQVILLIVSIFLAIKGYVNHEIMLIFKALILSIGALFLNIVARNINNNCKKLIAEGKNMLDKIYE